MNQFNTRIKMKKDSEENWNQNNPILLNGEIILIDTDSGELRAKVGDGVKTYTQLPFTDEILRNLITGKQNKLTGTQGQVVGFDSSGNAIAQEAPSGLPEGGTQGQLLAKGASSAEWVDNPTRAFGPQTVATSAWAADTTYSAQGYGFRASVPLAGVTADHIPDVTFAMADAVSGNLAPLAETYAGGIYIYAKEQPTATVNIASVVCTKGA